MKEKALAYREKVKEAWSGFSSSTKFMVVGSFFITVMVLFFFYFFSSKSEFAPLYSNLAPAEAGEIKAAIEERGILAEVSADGSVISVPEEELADLKVSLAAEGIPENGNVNYSVFSENMGLGMTDRHFDVVERDAMQNELAYLIRQIDGVTDANVMITLPKENIWITDEEQVATASIVVKGDPTFQLDQKQINGLYHLISKSIPNLPPEQIVIMDQNGRLFEIQQEDELDTALSVYQQQREIKEDIEQDIQRELQQLLGLTLGRDKVVVSVMTSMDFTKERREEKLVEPVNEETNEGIEISVERIIESYSSEGVVVEDAVGAGETEIANYPGTDGAGNSSSERTEERINSEVNRINRQIELSPYVIDDITINVGVEPPIPTDPASLTLQNVNDIRNILTNTVSTTLSMNGTVLTEEEVENRISVFATEFQGKPEFAVEEPIIPWWTTLPKNMLVYGVIGFGILLVVLLVTILLLRKKKRDDEENEYVMGIFDQPALNSKEDEEEVIDLSEFDSIANPKRKTIEKLAKERPEDFANLLRSWMRED